MLRWFTDRTGGGLSSGPSSAERQRQAEAARAVAFFESPLGLVMSPAWDAYVQDAVDEVGLCTAIWEALQVSRPQEWSDALVEKAADGRAASVEGEEESNTHNVPQARKTGVVSPAQGTPGHFAAEDEVDLLAGEWSVPDWPVPLLRAIAIAVNSVFPARKLSGAVAVDPRPSGAENSRSQSYHSNCSASDPPSPCTRELPGTIAPLHLMALALCSPRNARPLLNGAVEGSSVPQCLHTIVRCLVGHPKVAVEILQRCISHSVDDATAAEERVSDALEGASTLRVALTRSEVAGLLCDAGLGRLAARVYRSCTPGSDTSASDTVERLAQLSRMVEFAMSFVSPSSLSRTPQRLAIAIHDAVTVSAEGLAWMTNSAVCGRHTTHTDAQFPGRSQAARVDVFVASVSLYSVILSRTEPFVTPAVLSWVERIGVQVREALVLHLVPAVAASDEDAWAEIRFAVSNLVGQWKHVAAMAESCLEEYERCHYGAPSSRGTVPPGAASANGVPARTPRLKVPVAVSERPEPQAELSHRRNSKSSSCYPAVVFETSPEDPGDASEAVLVIPTVSVAKLAQCFERVAQELDCLRLDLVTLYEEHFRHKAVTPAGECADGGNADADPHEAREPPCITQPQLTVLHIELLQELASEIRLSQIASYAAPTGATTDNGASALSGATIDSLQRESHSSKNSGPAQDWGSSRSPIVGSTDESGSATCPCNAPTTLEDDTIAAAQVVAHFVAASKAKQSLQSLAPLSDPARWECLAHRGLFIALLQWHLLLETAHGGVVRTVLQIVAFASQLRSTASEEVNALLEVLLRLLLVPVTGGESGHGSSRTVLSVILQLAHTIMYIVRAYRSPPTPLFVSQPLMRRLFAAGASAGQGGEGVLVVADTPTSGERGCGGSTLPATTQTSGCAPHHHAAASVAEVPVVKRVLRKLLVVILSRYDVVCDIVERFRDTQGAAAMPSTEHAAETWCDGWHLQPKACPLLQPTANDGFLSWCFQLPVEPRAFWMARMAKTLLQHMAQPLHLQHMLHHFGAQLYAQGFGPSAMVSELVTVTSAILESGRGLSTDCGHRVVQCIDSSGTLSLLLTTMSVRPEDEAAESPTMMKQALHLLEKLVAAGGADASVSVSVERFFSNNEQYHERLSKVYHHLRESDSAEQATQYAVEVAGALACLTCGAVGQVRSTDDVVVPSAAYQLLELYAGLLCAPSAAGGEVSSPDGRLRPTAPITQVQPLLAACAESISLLLGVKAPESRVVSIAVAHPHIVALLLRLCGCAFETHEPLHRECVVGLRRQLEVHFSTRQMIRVCGVLADAAAQRTGFTGEELDTLNAVVGGMRANLEYPVPRNRFLFPRSSHHGGVRCPTPRQFPGVRGFSVTAWIHPCRPIHSRQEKGCMALLVIASPSRKGGVGQPRMYRSLEVSLQDASVGDLEADRGYCFVSIRTCDRMYSHSFSSCPVPYNQWTHLALVSATHSTQLRHSELGVYVNGVMAEAVVIPKPRFNEGTLLVGISLTENLCAEEETLYRGMLGPMTLFRDVLRPEEVVFLREHPDVDLAMSAHKTSIHCFQKDKVALNLQCNRRSRRVEVSERVEWMECSGVTETINGLGGPFPTLAPLLLLIVGSPSRATRSATSSIPPSSALARARSPGDDGDSCPPRCDVAISDDGESAAAVGPGTHQQSPPQEGSRTSSVASLSAGQETHLSHEFSGPLSAAWIPPVIQEVRRLALQRSEEFVQVRSAILADWFVLLSSTFSSARYADVFAVISMLVDVLPSLGHLITEQWTVPLTTLIHRSRSHPRVFHFLLSTFITNLALWGNSPVETQYALYKIMISVLSGDEVRAALSRRVINTFLSAIFQCVFQFQYHESRRRVRLLLLDSVTTFIPQHKKTRECAPFATEVMDFIRSVLRDYEDATRRLGPRKHEGLGRPGRTKPPVSRDLEAQDAGPKLTRDWGGTAPSTPDFRRGPSWGGDTSGAGSVLSHRTIDELMYDAAMLLLSILVECVRTANTVVATSLRHCGARQLLLAMLSGVPNTNIRCAALLCIGCLVKLSKDDRMLPVGESSGFSPLVAALVSRGGLKLTHAILYALWDVGNGTLSSLAPRTTPSTADCTTTLVADSAGGAQPLAAASLGASSTAGSSLPPYFAPSSALSRMLPQGGNAAASSLSVALTDATEGDGRLGACRSFSVAPCALPALVQLLYFHVAVRGPNMPPAGKTLLREATLAVLEHSKLAEMICQSTTTMCTLAKLHLLTGSEAPLVFLAAAVGKALACRNCTWLILHCMLCTVEGEYVALGRLNAPDDYVHGALGERANMSAAAAGADSGNVHVSNGLEQPTSSSVGNDSRGAKVANTVSSSGSTAPRSRLLPPQLTLFNAGAEDAGGPSPVAALLLPLRASAPLLLSAACQAMRESLNLELMSLNRAVSRILPLLLAVDDMLSYTPYADLIGTSPESRHKRASAFDAAHQAVALVSLSDDVAKAVLRSPGGTLNCAEWADHEAFFDRKPADVYSRVVAQTLAIFKLLDRDEQLARVSGGLEDVLRAAKHLFLEQRLGEKSRARSVFADDIAQMPVNSALVLAQIIDIVIADDAVVALAAKQLLCSMVQYAFRVFDEWAAIYGLSKWSERGKSDVAVFFSDAVASPRWPDVVLYLNHARTAPKPPVSMRLQWKRFVHSVITQQLAAESRLWSVSSLAPPASVASTATSAWPSPQSARAFTLTSPTAETEEMAVTRSAVPLRVGPTAGRSGCSALRGGCASSNGESLACTAGGPSRAEPVSHTSAVIAKDASLRLEGQDAGHRAHPWRVTPHPGSCCETASRPAPKRILTLYDHWASLAFTLEAVHSPWLTWLSPSGESGNGAEEGASASRMQRISPSQLQDLHGVCPKVTRSRRSGILALANPILKDVASTLLDRETILFQQTCEYVDGLLVWPAQLTVTDQALFLEVFDANWEKTCRSNLSRCPAQQRRSLASCPPSVSVDLISVTGVFPSRRFRMQNSAVLLRLCTGEVLLLNFPDSEAHSVRLHTVLSGLGLSLTQDPRIVSDPKEYLARLTHRWVHREISNFRYLMELNFLAGRCVQDLSQYPIFPWVLRRFNTETLDLSDPTLFRDFSLPMAAQADEQQEALRQRYELSRLNEAAPGTLAPHHYSTYYSCPASVIYYLFRVEPFATFHQILHDGAFDNVNRLFCDIESCATGHQRSTNDIKEMTPEMYYLPEVFQLSTRVPGLSAPRSHGEETPLRYDGSRVGDVRLPPWAKGSPFRFVAMLREALESDTVSQCLHEWIDYMFGCNQHGAGAVEHFNVFPTILYKDNIARIVTEKQGATSRPGTPTDSSLTLGSKVAARRPPTSPRIDGPAILSDYASGSIASSGSTDGNRSSSAAQQGESRASASPYTDWPRDDPSTSGARLLPATIAAVVVRNSTSVSDNLYLPYVANSHSNAAPLSSPAQVAGGVEPLSPTASTTPHQSRFSFQKEPTSSPRSRRVEPSGTPLTARQESQAVVPGPTALSMWDNLGQVPAQLFDQPHPRRLPRQTRLQRLAEKTSFQSIELWKSSAPRLAVDLAVSPLGDVAIVEADGCVHLFGAADVHRLIGSLRPPPATPIQGSSRSQVSLASAWVVSSGSSSSSSTRYRKQQLPQRADAAGDAGEVCDGMAANSTFFPLNSDTVPFAVVFSVKGLIMYNSLHSKPHMLFASTYDEECGAFIVAGTAAPGHSSPIRFSVVSQRRHYLMTSSWDAMNVLWSLPHSSAAVQVAPEKVGVLYGYNSNVVNADLCETCDLIAGITDDGDIVLHSLRSAVLESRIESRVSGLSPRNLGLTRYRPCGPCCAAHACDELPWDFDGEDRAAPHCLPPCRELSIILPSITIISQPFIQIVVAVRDVVRIFSHGGQLIHATSIPAALSPQANETRAMRVETHLFFVTGTQGWFKRLWRDTDEENDPASPSVPRTGVEVKGEAAACPVKVVKSLDFFAALYCDGSSRLFF